MLHKMVGTMGSKKSNKDGQRRMRIKGHKGRDREKGHKRKNKWKEEGVNKAGDRCRGKRGEMTKEY